MNYTHTKQRTARFGNLETGHNMRLAPRPLSTVPCWRSRRRAVMAVNAPLLGHSGCQSTASGIHEPQQYGLAYQRCSNHVTPSKSSLQQVPAGHLGHSPETPTCAPDKGHAKVLRVARASAGEQKYPGHSASDTGPSKRLGTATQERQREQH